MKHFEYEITKDSSDDFSRFVYFCTDKGECSLSQIPSGEITMLGEILNKRGAEGWELVQIIAGREGVDAFWKRESP